MRKIFLIYCFILLVLSFPLSLKSQQWVRDWSFYAVNYIESISSNGNDFFAGTEYNGLFISSNGGSNWKQSLNKTFIYCSLAIGDTIFVGYLEGVQKSTNKGKTWIQSGLDNMDVLSLVIYNNNIIAGTGFDGVYLSTNYGMNWIKCNIYGYCHWLRAFCVSGNKIFISNDRGLYVSSDGGYNWNSTFYCGSSNSVASIGSNVLASTLFGLYRSTNSGDNWALISQSITGKITTKGQNFCITRNNSVYISTDYGITWNQTNFNNPNITAFYGCDYGIFVGTKYNGIYFSTNDGINWIQVDMINRQILSLATGNDFKYVGTNGTGIIKIEDNNSPVIQTSLNNKSIFSIATNGTNAFAGVNDSGVYFSSDYGNNWNHTTLNNKTVYSLYINENNIYAGTANNGIYKSTNFGSNWVQTNLNNKTVISFSMNSNNIFAGTINYGVYLSTNNGSNWYQTSLNNKTVNSLTMIGGYIFAGTDSNGVLYTSDNGSNWLQTSLIHNNVSSVIADGNILIAGSKDGYGVYSSTNFGNYWYKKNNGLNPIHSILSLLTSNYTVYAGTDSGLYTANRSYIIGINDLSHIISNFFLFQNYPNPFNPSTNIKYQIPKNSFVSLKVFDILGKEIETLVNEKQSAGTYEAAFDASAYPSGVYFYRLVTDGFTDTKKMILLK